MRALHFPGKKGDTKVHIPVYYLNGRIESCWFLIAFRGNEN